MEQKYISNNIPIQGLPAPPSALLQLTLEQLVETTPPKDAYSGRHGELGGLFTGYTGLAYLFLRLSAMHPDMQIKGRCPLDWAKQYLDGKRGKLVLEKGNCGIASEKLSYEAVKACVTGDLMDVMKFISNIPAILGPFPPAEGDPYPSELAYGRAGTLYLLRMVKHWVPNSGSFVDSPLNRVAEKIMETDDDGNGNWEWHGKRYFGASHGDIGIITQIVLSDPSQAPQLAERLEDLIDIQLDDGNWPSSSRSLQHGRRAELVQWCHGAPGFIHSLQTLRPFYPDHQHEIDAAIKKAQDLVWRHGLLTKEPSLCHGIVGNALTLPRNEFREHFLALSTGEAVEKVKSHNAKLFSPANYGKESSVLMNSLPSAAWAWAVCEEARPPMIMYNDV
ncbi:LanC-like protein 2 [Paramyrothecium foliicola]|nr:LanC-like protein 2 [Paramyrothecium foliicola]